MDATDGRWRIWASLLDGKQRLHSHAPSLSPFPRLADKQGSASVARGGYGGGGAKAKPAPAEGPGLAQQRFGNAKSISSSAFHGADTQESEFEKQQR